MIQQMDKALHDLHELVQSPLFEEVLLNGKPLKHSNSSHIYMRALPNGTVDYCRGEAMKQSVLEDLGVMINLICAMSFPVHVNMEEEHKSTNGELCETFRLKLAALQGLLRDLANALGCPVFMPIVDAKPAVLPPMAHKMGTIEKIQRLWDALGENFAGVYVPLVKELGALAVVESSDTRKEIFKHLHIADGKNKFHMLDGGLLELLAGLHQSAPQTNEERLDFVDEQIALLRKRVPTSVVDDALFGRSVQRSSTQHEVCEVMRSFAGGGEDHRLVHRAAQQAFLKGRDEFFRAVEEKLNTDGEHTEAAEFVVSCLAMPLTASTSRIVLQVESIIDQGYTEVEFDMLVREEELGDRNVLLAPITNPDCLVSVSDCWEAVLNLTGCVIPETHYDSVLLMLLHMWCKAGGMYVM
jgi:hypothetical protein